MSPDDNPPVLKPRDRTKVLIADDEQAIRRIFLKLVSAGLPQCRIDVAVNGAEAVERFREVHYGVIVMDLRMPVMDGQAAFEKIREICTQENREMPSVIFCTGFEPSDGVKRYATEGQHGFVRKPVSNDVLLEEIRKRL